MIHLRVCSKDRNMTKFFILILLSVALFMTSCEKDPAIKKDPDTEEDSEVKKNPVLKKASIDLDGWEISNSNFDFNMVVRDLFFLNSDIGFLVGLSGKIIKTSDAGESWTRLLSGTGLPLFSVFFLDENNGFVAGRAMSDCLDEDCGKGSILLKTIDGGNTWSKQFFEEYTGIYSIRFIDELNGLSIIHTPDVPNSRDYFLSKTSDGGISWEFIDLDIKPHFNTFQTVDNVVFIPGEKQKIFKSIDFGDNWMTLDTPVPAWDDVRNIYFYDENLGFFGAGNIIYKTVDGGLKWEITNFPFIGFGAFHFYDENQGFNILPVTTYEGGDFPTYKGSITYQTFDAGENWETSDLNNSFLLSITFFPKRDLGYGFNGRSEFYTIWKKN